MIYGLVLVLHIGVALFLIAVVLLQGGRGGMGEALGGAAAQSLFGGGVNTVMTKLTAVVAGLFMVTCLSLAGLSTARGRSSVMNQLPITPEELPAALPQIPGPAPSAQHVVGPGTETSSQTPAPTPSATGQADTTQPQESSTPNDAPPSTAPATTD